MPSVEDPSVLAIFGQPPLSVDLSASTTARDNAVVITLSCLAVLAVAGRVWARKINKAKLGPDDMLIFFALALVLATMVLTILGGHFGSGKHVWSVRMTHLKMIFKVLYGYTFVYGAAAMAIKLSFVFTFARIFDTGIRVKYLRLRDYTRIAVWTGSFLAGAYLFMVWVIMFRVCTPISYFWNQYTEPGNGSCIDTTLFFLVAGIINMVIDIVILLVPIPCVLQLNLRLRQRVLLVCIFMLGGFVCVASAMRIHYLEVLRTSTDVTYSMGKVFIWSSVEPAIGIVSSCLISLRPTVQKILSAVLGTATSLHSDPTKPHEQPFSVYDGRSPDEELSLVCASSRKIQDHPTPDKRVVVTRKVDVYVSKSLTEEQPSPP